ncbi:hypothetical protein E4U42_006072 [Claviceps africana]|uniref:Uncharacterized protein n=1 Tax=Claviceps africana TaxID=83212 RepID=A0A8K0J2S9_9HYPO|nr:hypothetical protein E4U42_006072 [Claviceps africana]
MSQVPTRLDPMKVDSRGWMWNAGGGWTLGPWNLGTLGGALRSCAACLPPPPPDGHDDWLAGSKEPTRLHSLHSSLLRSLQLFTTFLARRLTWSIKYWTKNPSVVRLPSMALYAAGFNAWNQLQFDNDPAHGEDPPDVLAFAKVLTDDALQRPRAGLHYTLVRGQLGRHVAGAGFATGTAPDLDHVDTTFVAGNGLTLTVQPDETPTGLQAGPSRAPRQVGILKYESYEDCKAGRGPVALPCKEPVREVAAYEAGFVVLFQDGTVATLGDARYQECLARDVTQQSAAGRLELVPDLTSLGDPVKHVCANGYVLAALTESGSVYIWGRKSLGAHGQGAGFLEELGAIPNYCEVGGGLDVQDFALGDCHAIALTTGGDVYVIGANRNGQLGLGQGRDHVAREWTCVNLNLPTSHHVVAVAAGPRSSFIVTARK